jgi:hypothetical protein
VNGAVGRELSRYIYIAREDIKMDAEFDGGVEEETRETDAPDALTPKQERALQALLSSRSQKEAAHAAGVSETTL